MQQTTKNNIYEVDTQQCPIIQPCVTLSSSLTERFIKPAKPHHRYRYIVLIAMLQCLYGVTAVLLGGIVYWWLASQPVYRVVALVVVAILWSNIASVTARRKPIDMMETIEHPALKVWYQKDKKERRKAVYNEKTDVFLKAIKASFVEKNNEVR